MNRAPKKTAPPPPSLPPIIPAAVSLDYMLGTTDPALLPDRALVHGTLVQQKQDTSLLGLPSSKCCRHEVFQAQDFVESLPVGSHQITSRTVETGYNIQTENKNWFFAIGGYKRWGTGQAKVTQNAQGQRSYELDFTYKFFDRYNWDGGKSVTLFGIKITDHFMGEFHRQGLAREFDCLGAVRRRFTWKHGEDISNAQMSSPVTTARST